MWSLVLKPILAVLLLALATFGSGAWLQNCLPSLFRRFDRVVCGWLGGLGLFSLTLFLIGQWRFTPFVVASVLVLACLLAIGPSARLFTEIRQRCHRMQVPLVPVLIVSCALLFTCVSGLAEITGDWGVDAVAYHLFGPKVWLRNGVIHPVPDNCHTAMPQTAETIYAAAMALGGPRAPALSSLLTFGLLLLVAASLGRRVGLGSRGAWWTAALVAAMPAVWTGSTHLFVDGLYASFILAAIRVAFDARNPREFALVGLFCGLAMGTKYTGLLALPAVLCCPLAVAILAGKFNWKFAAKVVAALLVAGVVACPYYLRNWILLGSPIYPPPPVLDHVFGAKYLSQQTIASFHAYIRQRGQGLGRGVGAFLLLPYNLTYHTSNFHGAGGIGISALALGLFALVGSGRTPAVRALGLAALLLTVLWFVTQQESRFLIHVYVMSAIFAVLGWRRVLSLRQRSSRVLAGAVVAISLSYGIFMIGKDRVDDMKALLSARLTRVREQQGIPFLESFEYLNHEPSVNRVLILDPSVPPYYLDLNEAARAADASREANGAVYGERLK